MSYHTVIFAPDSLDPEGGPTLEVSEFRGLGQGYQSTLPVEQPDVLLLDQRGAPISQSVPSRRRIGFVR